MNECGGCQDLSESDKYKCGHADGYDAGYKLGYEKAKVAHDLMLANLTATQARCTELLEEVRRLKREADEFRDSLDDGMMR